ncbi:MAG: histidine kinase dimerization/phospho-acceptor domain-containing protein [Caldilineaceae bacterium]
MPIAISWSNGPYQLEEKSLALETASAELRAANERLQELDRLKDEFISTVTHELRTPLTSIRAFSEILHDNPLLDAAKRTHFLEIILRERTSDPTINQVPIWPSWKRAPPSGKSPRSIWPH